MQKQNRNSFFLLCAGLSIVLSPVAFAEGPSGPSQLFFSLNLGYGIIQSSSNYETAIGNGKIAGSTGILPNSTSFRDASQYLHTASGGITLGYLKGGMGGDLCARYLMGRGAVNRYVSNSSGVITVSPGDIDYRSLAMDFGFRYYLLSVLYLRPHLGETFRGQYSYSFLNGPTQVDFEKSPALSYGLGAAVMIGGSLHRIEIGADYTMIGSAWGGHSAEATFFINPGLFW